MVGHDSNMLIHADETVCRSTFLGKCVKSFLVVEELVQGESVNILFCYRVEILKLETNTSYLCFNTGNLLKALSKVFLFDGKSMTCHPRFPAD